MGPEVHIVALSSSDLAVLTDLLSREKARNQNQQSWRTPHRTGPAPEAYIVKIPDGGLPGVTDFPAGALGTGYDLGTGTVYVPNGVECQVYEDMSFGTAGYIEDMIAVPGLTKIVQNVSAGKICSGFYPIIRDKFGRWVVLNVFPDVPDGVPVSLVGFDANGCPCKTSLGPCVASDEALQSGTNVFTGSNTFSGPVSFVGNVDFGVW